MTISIIIPTYNEAQHIKQTVMKLRQHGGLSVVEIMVVDGGSQDNTLAEAKAAGAIVLTSPQKGRAAQMNFGAKHAKGEILYFVHADVSVPASYVTDIQESLTSGHELGCYQYQFDSPKFMLKINAYFTRFSFLFCRGGDQTLYITRGLFDQLGGFEERFVIMEDYDILIRATRLARLKIIPKNAIVSARKYENNAWLRVQLANLTAMLLFNFKANPQRIARTYKKMLK